MSNFTQIGSLPQHQYVKVDNKFTRHSEGWEAGVWFGLVSVPGRAWGCHVLLECGAVYRNLPLHALSFEHEEYWDLEDSQTWNCYSERFTLHQYQYLVNLDCLVKTASGHFLGNYLFTAAPIGDGFTAEPSQNKEYMFIRLRNGRITAQPTNFVCFNEASFTDPLGDSLPSGLKAQTEVYAVDEIVP
jgi:hypothetical protein